MTTEPAPAAVTPPEARWLRSGFRNVLVFAAHPDDEVIGCGGLLRLLANLGLRASVVVATGGGTGVSEAFTDLPDLAEHRRRESERSQQLLGIHELHFLGHATQRLANDQTTFHQCIHLIRKIQPDLVLTHSPADTHRDHRALAAVTGEAVYKAWENIMPALGPRHRVAETWLYEVQEPLAAPDVVVDISDTLDTKLEALAAHHTQSEILTGLETYLRGLAQVRGYQGNCRYGEAFHRRSFLPRLY